MSGVKLPLGTCHCDAENKDQSVFAEVTYEND